jgi:hypothetical protein
MLHGEGGVCRRYYGHCDVVCVSRLLGKQSSWPGCQDGITREGPCVAAIDVNEAVIQMKWIVGSATEIGQGERAVLGTCVIRSDVYQVMRWMNDCL